MENTLAAMTWNEALTWASGTYLQHELPMKWPSWNDEQLQKFINDNRADIVKNADSRLIFEYIEVLALDMLKLLQLHAN